MNLINFLIVLIILCSISNQFTHSQPIQNEINNNEIQIINKLNSETKNSNFFRISPGKSYKVYNLGERIDGDKLINEKSDKQSFPSAQDVGITLTYPDNNKKSWKITYVNILVEQTSSIGNGYVIDGGVQEEFIAVRLEANKTLHFAYVATFYGY